MMQAVEGAEDQVGRSNELIDVGAKDVMVALAASGTTPFTVSCLREARRRGALTIGIANNRDTPLLSDAEHGIFLDTGAEPIAGSTRMNAGTAQRITLSLLSTLVMIRLGHVYRGLMVDVQAANTKLTRRKREMLMHLTGSRATEAEAALLRADGNVKLAVLLLNGCNLERALSLLERTGGKLRAAIAMATIDKA
jgi:N-acetylmuramic acid 6-phosphate etherase